MAARPSSSAAAAAAAPSTPRSIVGDITVAELSAPQAGQARQLVLDDGRANPKFYGGFRGLAADTGRNSPAERRRKEISKRAAIVNNDDRPVPHIDELAVRCAEVPFGAWAAQKEKRVATAFTRIVERDWYDKWEMTLRPVERIHINAVREHYAMRRDKIKTPDIKARPNSNTLTKKGWAESLEAMEVLNRDTHVGTFFHGLVGKTMAKRQRREEKERLDAERARAEAEARRAQLSVPK